MYVLNMYCSYDISCYHIYFVISTEDMTGTYMNDFIQKPIDFKFPLFDNVSF